jgi:hypothetical protein
MSYPIRPKNLKKIGVDNDNVAALRDLQRKVTALTEGQPNQAGVGSLTWSDALGTFTITKPGGTVVPVGTVTSVAASGGTTGLTFSGSPIIGSGTLTLGGTLDLDNGGTGATTPTAARSNLGAAASGANSDITSLSGITGGISTVDSITFDTAAGVTVSQGQIAWNIDDGTVYFGMGYGGVIQHVGFDQYFRIKASAAITKGQCVMFDGAVGASGVLKGKPSTGVTNPQYIMGVATMDIALNGFGYITSFGTVRGINTTGSSVGETWVDGDILFYNPAYVGGLTKVEPIAPNPKVVVAAVTNAGSGGSGSLFIRVQAEPYLQGLTDVYAPSPISNGQILIGDGPQSRWEAATLTAGSNVSITNAAGAITINASDAYVGTVTSVNLTAGTGIAVSGGPITSSGSITVTNTAPDQVVSLTGAGTTAVTGTYPSFTITSNDQYVGTVTSVSGAGTVNGITLTGSVTSSGSLTLGGTLSGIANSQLTNSSITINGSAISLGGSVSVGTVTSVGGTGSVNGITLTGTVTSSGSLTLGGTLSNVSLTTQVTGTLPVGNGGTGTATAFTSGSIVFANTSGIYAQDNANFNWNNTNKTLGVGRTASSNVRIYSKGGTTGSGAFSYYGENSAGTGCFGIRDDGAFFSGAASLSPYNLTTAAAANLVVAADYYLYRSTSSARYKKNIVDYDRGLDAVMSLRPVYYEGKGEIDEGKRFAGFVAEEVYDAGLTEFVVLDEEGKPDALHYGNMNALLVSALQEAVYHITILIKRVNELEKKQ